MTSTPQGAAAPAVNRESLLDAFRQVAAALFPEDIDHLMTHTPLGDAVDALVGRVKQLRRGHQESVKASMEIAERSRQIARALGVSEAMPWKWLVTHVAERDRLAQRLEDVESARDKAFRMRDQALAQLEQVEAQPQPSLLDSALYSLAARFGVNTNQRPSEVERDIVAMVETLKHDARAAKPEAPGFSELDPGPTTIGGCAGPFPDPELTSIRAELAALGKHLDDVERRAYACPGDRIGHLTHAEVVARLTTLERQESQTYALVSRLEKRPTSVPAATEGALRELEKRVAEWEPMLDRRDARISDRLDDLARTASEADLGIARRLDDLAQQTREALLVAAALEGTASRKRV